MRLKLGLVTAIGAALIAAQAPAMAQDLSKILTSQRTARTATAPMAIVWAAWCRLRAMTVRPSLKI